MSRYIDADELRKRMYHDAFEVDSDMQKWDSGCWIRYKMFENAIDDAPTVDVVPTNALRLFIEWASECDFGYDSIPDEYEKYKDDIEDMGWTEGLMYIVLKEIEVGVYVPQY